MAAAVLDEVMFRGDTRLIRFQVVNDETGEAVGTIAGWDFLATAKAAHGDTDEDALFQLSLGDGIEVIDDPESIIEITISPADTAASTGRTAKYYLDVQAIDTDMKTWTLGAGRLTVRADVTLQAA